MPTRISFISQTAESQYQSGSGGRGQVIRRHRPQPAAFLRRRPDDFLGSFLRNVPAPDENVESGTIASDLDIRPQVSVDRIQQNLSQCVDTLSKLSSVAFEMTFLDKLREGFLREKLVIRDQRAASPWPSV